VTLNGRPLVVGVAECIVTRDPHISIITYALGSCVAVAIHDPVVRVGGLLHVMLPTSSLDPGKAAKTPWMFADTGVALLIRNACRAGADKSRLVVRLAGGSQVMDEAGRFNIGHRNCVAVREALRTAGVAIHGESTGGNGSRTIILEIGSGRVLLRCSPRVEQDPR
jgi:chemotaxis protein CheD